jgi:hypothetical protein
MSGRSGQAFVLAGLIPANRQDLDSQSRATRGNVSALVVVPQSQAVEHSLS